MSALPASPNSLPATVLAVDDSPDALELIKRHLLPAGHRVIAASGADEAVRLLKETACDLVITDMKMPKVSGLDLIRHIRHNFRGVGILMVTGYPTIGGAVEAVRLGAEDYLAKPFTRKELLEAVEKALTAQRQRTLGQAATPAPAGIIGESAAMQAVFHAIRKAAAVKANVLITGESGTGKELVARAIHYRSDRAAHPFVPVNCGGIPEGLLESELFGRVKGAFTGATDTRAGFFQTGHKGTLFLDEVGETSLPMQVKLLRVLQEKEICMVGSAKPQTVDVRIIAGTNKNLQSLIAAGRFREDLFYRLNVITIELPPLRHRDGDVLLLVRYFTAKYAEEMSRPAPHFSDRALETFKGYSWPGNVRELENLIQRLIAMSEADVIDAPDLPAAMRSECLIDGRGFDRSLDEVEQEYIRHVLDRVGGNKTRAAAVLKIDRKTLRDKLKRMRAAD
ncbi:MAG: sigma-54-dependent Fis family transcriptional regulator [Desulfobacteraceae bacterium]|nr:MAG: sigma-54-dependent Fis family transcriptional regulator [Desulfobacteraceae bacterium]